MSFYASHLRTSALLVCCVPVMGDGITSIVPARWGPSEPQYLDMGMTQYSRCPRSDKSFGGLRRSLTGAIFDYEFGKTIRSLVVESSAESAGRQGNADF
jgi:hypothetical protein